jgi:hypothetical protein
MRRAGFQPQDFSSERGLMFQLFPFCTHWKTGVLVLFSPFGTTVHPIWHNCAGLGGIIFFRLKVSLVVLK